MLDDATVRSLALEQITLGGEAVPGPLLEELRRLFPAARISQVYASAEAGSSVSVRDGRSGLPLSVLERGDSANVQFRIVDGELHARSRVGMLGYAGQDDEGDDWRPTGDLVEIEGDRIYFVGRRSEIINVGGVKVQPLRIEEIVSGIDGVALAHVYGRANPVTGQIVAVDVVAQPGADTDDLKERIRAACASLPPAAQPRRIKFVETVELRESKILRRPGDLQQTS
jgi:acyl-CoA synthetase (AMP-forming)/AMP-acid ligase II